MERGEIVRRRRAKVDGRTTAQKAGGAGAGMFGGWLGAPFASGGEGDGGL